MAPPETILVPQWPAGRRVRQPRRMAALSRAARTAIVSAGFVIGQWAVDEVQVAVFATFTGLAVLGIANFGGGGELSDPADVVPVVRCLAAPETRWVTAQTVYVNGGMISPLN